MTAGLSDIVIDCARPASLARFWAAALDGYTVRPYDAGEIARLAAIGITDLEDDPSVAVDGPGPTLFFQRVPEPKAGKNRVHLDLVAAHRTAEVARLVSIGARILAELETWTVLADPESNEFCVADG